MDRLDAMQVLLAVVDAGSLSAASRKLRAPLPSVSRKVAELERHLGTNLLIRTSRNVQLTDAGRDYVAAAREIVAQVRDAEARASGEFEVPRGTLTLTVPMAFGRDCVLPLAYEFLDAHPEINLDVLSLDRRVQLIDEHIDVAVRLGDLADSSEIAIKLGAFHLLTCASPDYLARRGCPMHPADLVNHDAAVYAPLNAAAWLYEHGSQRTQGMPVTRIHTNTSTAAVNAAIRGLAITRAPSYQVHNALRTGQLISILEDYEDRAYPVHFMYVRQGLLPLKVRTFLDWMTPRLREVLKELVECRTATIAERRAVRSTICRPDETV